MKPNAAATAKLLTGLTGKEAFSIFIGNYMENMKQQSTTFSDADLTKLSSDLDRRPYDKKQCYNWWQAYQAIHHLGAEARRMAMEAIWRISTVILGWNYERCANKNKEILQEEILAEKPMIKTARTIIADYARLRLLLEAFGEMHGCDVVYMLNYEEKILHGCIEHYNQYADFLNDAYFFDNWKEEDENEPEPPLPLLTLNPADIPTDLKNTLSHAIDECFKDGNMWEVLRAFDRELRGV